MRTHAWLFLMPLLFGLAACTGDTQPDNLPEPSPEPESTAIGDTMAAAGQPQKINLNTGTEEEFMTIPGMSERMVDEFEEYRPYVSIQQFRREMEKYVDADQVAAYERYVYVPINPNESDAPTLRQIPGLDESEAQQLIAGRPYASSGVFLERLGQYVSPDEAATARTYLVQR